MSEDLENKEEETSKMNETKKVTKTKKTEQAESKEKNESNPEKENKRSVDLAELMEKIQEEMGKLDKEIRRTEKQEAPIEKKETKSKKDTKQQEKIATTKKEKTKKQKEGKHIAKRNNTSKSKELIVQKNQKEWMMNPEKLEKIEEEIKKQTTIPEEKKNKMNKIIFHNIAIANVVMLYFIFLILGYQSILPETFIVDLQVFSVITIGIAILIFEKAYKKDNSEYAIHGIETLFLAIVTLISIYVYAKYQDKFTSIMLVVCYVFAIYYVAKSIIIYLKMRTKALKRASDIHKIAKK